MDQIQLGLTQHRTTRVGFGCAHLVGAMSWRESLAILETAYDLGIRHFDVAAMYGFGEAERCLGRFLQEHRDDRITVTTKFGIPRGKRRRLYRFARSVGRPFLARLRRPRPRQAETPRPEPRINSARFDVELATASLHASLIALETDYIHVLLLHEPAANELIDDRLIRFLEDAVQAGKVGTLGVGSDIRKIPELLQNRREYCPVTQYQWCALDDKIGPTPWFRIHHGSFSLKIRDLRTRLCAAPNVRSTWSDFIGRDLAEPGQVEQLVMRIALTMNPDSIVLFATRSPEHVRANCKAVADPALALPAMRFYQLIQQSKLGQDDFRITS